MSLLQLPPKFLDRSETIARIRKALRTRSGKAWSVTGGRGTAWGWISIDAPAARQTWRFIETGRYNDQGYPIFDESNDQEPGRGHMGPDERKELATLLGLETAGACHHQGVSIPASGDHYREYVDRAEGRTPAKIAEQYWD